VFFLKKEPKTFNNKNPSTRVDDMTLGSKISKGFLLFFVHKKKI